MVFRGIAVYRIVAIIILTFIVFFTANFAGEDVSDSWSYVEVAEIGFESDWLGSRPWGYPLLIKFAYLFSDEPFPVIVFIQCLFYIFSFCLLLYICSKVEQVKNSKTAVTVLLLAFINPQTLYYLSFILPEIIPLFFIILAIVFTIINISHKRQVLIYSLSIFIPILFKPLWIFLLILPVSKLFAYKKSIRVLLFNCIIPLALSLSFYTFHILLNKKLSQGNIIASTMDINLNLALIRMGLLEGSEGTQLYNHLEELQLIKSIKNRDWNVHNENKLEYGEFLMIKDTIPWEVREDKMFWKNVLKKPQNMVSFLYIQSNRVLYFFTTSAANSHIDLGISPLNYLYQVFYNKIHKIIILPLFLFFTYRVIRSINTSTFYMLFVPWLVIVTGAIVLSFLTYQNAHFLRMRTLLEVFLLIACFGELAYWLQYLKLKLQKLISDKRIPDQTVKN